jgi:uncharacterized protein
MVKASRLSAALMGFAVLLAIAWVGLVHSPLPSTLGARSPRAFASFALLFAPLWFSGFGADQLLKPLPGRTKILGAGFLALGYLVFAFGTPLFAWRALGIVVGFPVLLGTLLRTSCLRTRMLWRDFAVLALITAAYFLRWFVVAWPLPELTLLAKLFLADVALYCFFVIRELGGTGYTLWPTWSAVKVGMREWAFYFPLALILGESTRFIHFHATRPAPGRILPSLVFTLFLIALPEELFFRAILQNLLETRYGKNAALLLAATWFGLSHFNHGRIFNWRYVLLAAIAGIFYGRAWRANREILASILTHTGVDVVWSLWFR